MICTAIYLYGQNLNPATASEILEITPSESQVKNGKRAGDETGKYAPAKTGMWMLESSTGGSDLSAQVEKLLEMIGNQGTPLNMIEGVEEAWLDVLIIAESAEFVTEKGSNRYNKWKSPKIPSSQIKRLGELGLSVSFTISAPS